MTTPRTDELVRELKRIHACDWTIDLIKLAQTLERDLAARDDASAVTKAELSFARERIKVLERDRAALAAALERIERYVEALDKIRQGDTSPRTVAMVALDGVRPKEPR
jgi:hypothetical protein